MGSFLNKNNLDHEWAKYLGNQRQLKMAISFPVRVMKWQLCNKREDPPSKGHTLYVFPSGCSIPNHCKVGAKGEDAMTAIITDFLCHGEMWKWCSGILLWGWRLYYPQTGTISSRHLRSPEGICGNEGLLSPQKQISQRELYSRTEFGHQEPSAYV